MLPEIIWCIAVCILIVISAILLIFFIRAYSLYKKLVKTRPYTFVYQDKEITLRLTEAQYTGILSLVMLFKFNYDIDILQEKNIKI